MTIAEGTWGTIPWSISDAGALTIGGGVQPDFVIQNYPWLAYADSITSISITGDISQSFDMFGTPQDGTRWYLAFSDLYNLISVSGLSHLKHVKALDRLFDGCRSLSSLDLSGLDTSEAGSWQFMLDDCDTLTTVTFGVYSISKMSSTDRRLRLIDSPNYRTAEKNGLVVSSDDQFVSITDSERAGTWTRKPTETQIKCTAYRTDSGSESDDGSDATFKFTYALMGTDTALVRIFQKAASESSYPSTPVATTGLPAPSGATTYTIEDIGDGTYDFRIEVVDDGKTYVFFPEISSNVHLVDITRDGSVTVYGGADIRQGLDVAGSATLTGALSAASAKLSGLLEAARAVITKASGDTSTNALTVNDGTNDVLAVTWGGDVDMGETQYLRSTTVEDATAVPSANQGVTNRFDYDGSGNRVGYSQIFRTPTGVYRSFAVTNPTTGNSAALYLNSQDDGTRTVDMTGGVAWPVKNGGTGATSAAGARTNLGLGSLATKDSVALTRQWASATSSKQTLNAGAGKEIGVTCAVPSGYVMSGIVDCNINHNLAGTIGGFRYSGGTAYVSVTNRSSSQWTDLTVTVYYACLKADVS